MRSLERSRLEAITNELDTIRLSRGPVMAELARPIHELLGGELFWTYRPVLGADGWDLVDVHGSNVDHYIARFRRALARVRGDFAWFRPSRPDPAQRNRVVEALSSVRRKRPGYFEDSVLYREFFEPERLHEHHQLRVLICDGSSLLAWFGIYQRERPTRSQARLLAALVPSLQRRFVRDRQLREAPRTEAALDVALDHLGVPAFVVTARGRVEVANELGRQRLEREPDITVSLADAVAGRRTAQRVELSKLQSGSGTVGYLALLPAPSGADRRIEGSVERWALTPRQADVLRLLARGTANATIADALSISERAVELHVSAIFDKAGVESRAALVAAVLARGD